MGISIVDEIIGQLIHDTYLTFAQIRLYITQRLRINILTTRVLYTMASMKIAEQLLLILYTQVTDHEKK